MARYWAYEEARRAGRDDDARADGTESWMRARV